MTISHKAYEFDWDGFCVKLRALILAALSSDNPTPLIHWVETHREYCRDPYEGQPLPVEWKLLLERSDVQEIADFALTAFYDPTEDDGIGDTWQVLSDSLPPAACAALLGTPLRSNVQFDPGKMGSYFQDPVTVRASLAALRSCSFQELVSFKNLLQQALHNHTGIYVTF